MTSPPLVELPRILLDAAKQARSALSGLSDWGLNGQREDQYHHDTLTDSVLVELLVDAGLGVWTEESGLHEAGRELLACVDPIDGSTNASLRIPWFSTSICVLDSDARPVVSVVVNQATGDEWVGVSGQGAMRNGVTCTVKPPGPMADSMLCVNGYSRRHLGWRQYRALGSAALEISSVGSGSFDAWLDAVPAGLQPWDYMGGALVCIEAGGSLAEVHDREIFVREPSGQRQLVFASNADLAQRLVEFLRTVAAEN